MPPYVCVCVCPYGFLYLNEIILDELGPYVHVIKFVLRFEHFFCLQHQKLHFDRLCDNFSFVFFCRLQLDPISFHSFIHYSLPRSRNGNNVGKEN